MSVYNGEGTFAYLAEFVTLDVRQEKYNSVPGEDTLTEERRLKMRNTHFAVATHILLYLAIRKHDGLPPVSSSTLARSVNTHDTFIRQVLGGLTEVGWVASRAGRGGGYQLVVDPNNLSLRHVHDVVVGQPAIARHNTQPDAGCPVGQNIFSILDTLWEDMAAQLSKVTVGGLSQWIIQQRDGTIVRSAC